MPAELKDSDGDLQISEKSELHHKWATVEDFLKDLGNAIEENARVIRETEFDHSGDYQGAFLYWGDERETVEVFVDRLGRVILPSRDKNRKVDRVEFGGKPPQKVLNVEPRYRGEEITSWVLYLDPLEDDNDS